MIESRAPRYFIFEYNARAFTGSKLSLYVRGEANVL